ncbi:MAG: glycosyltransferase family 2 protein [Actinobacteria bacterium]|nr:glycosyltransferase family 2 protein [Actinomycetota bacterium]
MKDSAKHIAILMTCHNRREETLGCLRRLFEQKLNPEVKLKVYLVDDGSIDATSEAVQASYPEVKVIKGDGSLYWGGGMRLAFAEALRNDYDYYLWLNDDTMLQPGAVGSLLSAHQSLANRGKSNSIVAGQAQDPITGALTYGGVIRPSRWWPLKFRPIEANGELQECETMDGNCVLIPREVAKLVGNLDKIFTHRSGDWDYGLRARMLGCSIWVMPGFVGTCTRNPESIHWMGTNLPLIERLKKVNHPKGIPLRERMVYSKRHAGPFWYLYWMAPYVYLFVGPTLKKLRRR